MATRRYIERFNCTCREEVPNLNAFNTLAEVRVLTKQWLNEYTRLRPHGVLDGMTPLQYAADRPLAVSTYRWT